MLDKVAWCWGEGMQGGLGAQVGSLHCMGFGGLDWIIEGIGWVCVFFLH